MRTLLLAIYRLLWLTSWAAVILAGCLIVFEETGLLTRSVKKAMVFSIGPVARGIEIGHARLLWFEPALILENVRVRAPARQARGTAPRASAATSEGPELIFLDRLHVSLGNDLGKQPVSRVEVSGGSICISPSSWNGLNRLATMLSTSEPRELDYAPTIVIAGLRVSLELPGGEKVDVGTVGLRAHPTAELGLELSGALEPRLSGAVRGTRPIRVEGLLQGSSLEVQAATRGISLETTGIEVPRFLGSMPVAEFGGKLALSARGSIEFGGPLEIEGSLRARVFDARMLPRQGDPWIEQLELDVETEFHPGTGADLWDRDAWDAVARVWGQWNGTPIEAWAELGQRTKHGAWARCFARAPRLPLEPTTLEALGVMEVVRPHWEAFAPTGTVDVSAELVLRREDSGTGEPSFVPKLAIHARHTGETGMTFHGYRDPLEGPDAEPWGVPMPCSGIRGQTTFVLDEDLSPPHRLLLADISGRHTNGTGVAWCSIRGFDSHGEMDVEFFVPDAVIDERLRDVLRQSRMTREVPHDYDPIGGICSTRWRFRIGPDTHQKLAAWGRIWVAGAQARWYGIPVPVRGLSGLVELVWAEHRTQVRDTKTSLLPIGVRWDVQNRNSEHRGVTAEVHGFYRQESLPPVIDADRKQEYARRDLIGVDVRIDEMLLRGQNWDVLARTIPELSVTRDQLQAVGGIGVSFEGGRAIAGAPWISNVEARPLDAEVTPTLFPRRTQNLEGRILVQSRVESGANDGGETSTRFVLAGTWPEGVELAGEAWIPPSGNARVRVLGAGISPDNRAFVGALNQALSLGDGAGGVPLNLSNLSLSGVFDAEVISVVDVAPNSQPQNTYRAYLRETSLHTGDFLFEKMRGAVETRGNVIRSQRIEALLTDHPVVLSDVAVAPLSLAGGLDDFDTDILPASVVAGSRGSTSPVGTTRIEGLALQASVEATDYPFDQDHVERLMRGTGPAGDSPPEESQPWSARLDVRGARVSLVDSAGSAPKLMIRGPMRIREARLRSALPIEVDSARVDVEELVFEGGGVSAWGKITGLQGSLAGRELTNASMILGFVDQRLTIDDFRADFVGGKLNSLGSTGPGTRKALGVDLTPPHRFDLALELSGVDLGRLLQGVFESSIADEGLLSGTLQLAGTPEDILGLSGRGSLSLNEGRLWSIPAARELFSSLGFRNTAVFDRLRARFELREGHLQTHFIAVESALLNLVGQGWHDLDGRLGYDFEVRTGILDRLGIFNRIIYWLSGNLIHVSVRGELGRPEVQIRSALLELLRGSPEEPPRRLPLPEFAPIGPRF